MGITMLGVALGVASRHLSLPTHFSCCMHAHRPCTTPQAGLLFKLFIKLFMS